MTAEQFTIWMKGFVAACNEYTATPMQWDLLKEKLNTVVESKFVETPSTFPVHPQSPDPRIPNGTSPIQFTGTAYSPVSGSWYYTNSNDKTLLHD